MYFTTEVNLSKIPFFDYFLSKVSLMSTNTSNNNNVIFLYLAGKFEERFGLKIKHNISKLRSRVRTSTTNV